MKMLKRGYLMEVTKKTMLFALLGVMVMPSVAQETNDVLSVQYAPGEVMQLIAPITVPEKRHLRDRYFAENAETARIHGYRQEGVLIVDETLEGGFSPNVFVVSRWPSLKAQKAFQALPLFSSVKSLRREAWEALKLYDHELPSVASLQFRKDKVYTLAFAWVNPSDPSDYYEYMAGLPQLLDKAGGRLMHTIDDVVLNAHDPHALAPQQIAFVEWESHDGVKQLQALPEFKALAHKLRAGTVRFELHRVRPQL